MLIPERVPSWPVWIREFTDGKGDSYNYNISNPSSNPMEIEMDVIKSEGDDQESEADSHLPYSSPSSQSIFSKIRTFFDMDSRFPRLTIAKMSKRSLAIFFICLFIFLFFLLRSRKIGT